MIKFFKTPADFRKWLAANHKTADEQWVGFYKVGTGKPSITWNESVDEALCFGWIDGLRKKIDEEAYKIRFTPRRPNSVWSAKNIKRAEELVAEGRMRAPGLRELDKRRADKSAIYSYEQDRKTARLGAVYEKEFKADPAAWKFYQKQPPWYRRTAAFWVISAKQEATRKRRLRRLIEDSAAGRSIKQLERKK